MRKHHSVPISYPPKLEAVRKGDCRQTIRMGRRYAVGDRVTLFAWSGEPHRSKWAWKRNEVLLVAADIMLAITGITAENEFWGDTVVCDLMSRGFTCAGWGAIATDILAEMDFIDPPTGFALKAVLEGFHGPITEPVTAQVLRW